MPQRRGTLIVWPMVVALMTLALLAYASPPDPTHIAGLWDDGDYDDIVILTTFSSSLSETYPPASPPLPLIVVTVICAVHDQLPCSRPLSSRHTRAPPAA
jgi:hypothetical protein